MIFDLEAERPIKPSVWRLLGHRAIALRSLGFGAV